MRPPVLILAALTLPCGGTHLATDYARERTLRVTSELEVDLETTSFEMLVDGEPAEDRGRGGGGGSSLVRRAVVVDHVLEGAADGPRHLKRSFESLHDESSFSFGEDERTDEHDFPLQGVTLELKVEDGEVHAELADGPEPGDSALLEGHALPLAIDALLPEGDVDVDASWSLDNESIVRALATALDPRLFPEPAPEEFGRGGREGDRGERRGPPRGGRGGPARNLGLLEWEGKAKLVAIEDDVDGSKGARIALEISGKGDLPEPNFRGPGRGFAFAPATAREGTISAELKGELLISLEHHRPVSLELDGELRVENRFEREREGRTFSSHSVQSGRMTLNVGIEE